MSDRASSHLLRTGRYSCSGQIYLITTNTHKRQPVFRDFHIGRLVVNEMRRVHEEGLVSSLAWVVMPDHVHWLFELNSASLRSVMQLVKGRSAIAVNRALGVTGSLWQPGFHDRALRAEEDLIQLVRYVIANPIRAGLVRSIRRYPLWDAVWL